MYAVYADCDPKSAGEIMSNDQVSSFKITPKFVFALCVDFIYRSTEYPVRRKQLIRMEEKSSDFILRGVMISFNALVLSSLSRVNKPL